MATVGVDPKNLCLSCDYAPKGDYPDPDSGECYKAPKSQCPHFKPIQEP